MKKTAVFIVLFLLFAGAVWGQAKFTWTGDGDGSSWETPGNWDVTDANGVSSPDYPGGDSRTDDTVTFDKIGTSTINITDTVTIKDLKIDSDSNVTVTIGTSGSFEINGTLTNDGTLILSGDELSAGTLTNDGTFTFNGGELSAGTLTNNDTFDFTGDEISVTSTLNNSGNLDLGGADLSAGTLNNTGNIKLQGSQTVKIGGSPPAGRIGGTVEYYGSTPSWMFGYSYTNLIIDNLLTMDDAGVLDISGNAVFGSGFKATSLTVGGNTDINADIDTAGGNQTYTGTVTLGGNVILTGATVTLGAIDGNTHSLTIAGNGVFNNGGSGIGALIVNGVSGNFSLTGGNLSAASVSVGGTSNIGADVTTTGGAQTYTGAVTLGKDVELTGATVTFGGLINGSNHSLTIDGAGVLNSVSNINNLSVSGAATINTSITTTGNQTYGAVTLSDDVTLTSTSTTGLVTLGAITGTAHSLIITGNGVFSGLSSIKDLSVSKNFTLTSGTLSATSIDVDGTSNISGNVTTTGGTQDYKTVTLGGNAVLTGATVTLGAVDGNNHSLTITGNGVLNGGSGIGALSVSGNFGLTGSALSAVSVSVGGTSNVAADITTAGNQTYTGTVTLGGTGTRTLTGSTVTLGAVDGNNHSLTITGNGVFNGGSDINALSVSGTSTINGDITTAGNQTYGAVTLGNNVTLEGATVTLGTITGASHTLTITGNGTFSGGSGIGALTVSKNFSLLGSSLSAASIDVTGTSSIAENITTTGAQTYTGAVTLSGTDALITLQGPTVSMIEAVAGGGKSLTITGNGTFNKGGSNINALSVSGNFGLTGNSLSAASVRVTGTSNIDKPITTTGNQTYGAVTLGDDLTLTSTNGTVTLGNIIGNNHSLTITGNGAFNNGGSNIDTLSVSGNFILASGTLGAVSVSVTGTSNIASDITTTGNQSYTGTVTLGGAANALRTLTGATVTLGAIIGNNHPLTITGNGTFNNGGSGIGALSVSGDFALTGSALSAASVSVTGTSNIDSDMTTTGNQSYTGAVTLGGTGKRTITSENGNILFSDDLTSAGVIELSATSGNTTTNGKITIGGATTAGQLIAKASGDVSTDAITVSSDGAEGVGAAIYIEAHNFTPTTTTQDSIVPGLSGQLCLVLNVAWADGNGIVKDVRWHDHFAAIINLSNKHLIYGGIDPGLDGGSGTTIDSVPISSPYVYVSDTNVKTTFILDPNYNVYIYNANSNNTSGLTFETKGTGEIYFVGTNKFEKITVKSATAINIGSDVTTNGTQTYSGAVTLSDSITLKGATVTLGTVTGAAHQLTITGNGVLNGGSSIGALSVSGTTAINANIDTAENQTYTGKVTLGGNVILKSTTGKVTLGAVDGGGNSLTITGNGVLNGNGTDINVLSVSEDTAINADITTTGAQIYTGDVTLGGSGTRALQGTTVTLGTITGNNHSLSITGNGTFSGGGTGINALSISGNFSLTGGSLTAVSVSVAGTSNIAEDITTTGDQIYTGAATLGGASKRTISSSGKIQFQYTLTSSNEIELSAANITISGKTTAKQLIARAPNGTVSVDEIKIDSSTFGNHKEDAAIYILANTFIVTTTAPKSIVPGGGGIGIVTQWGQLCLDLQYQWTDTNGVVDGDEDEGDEPPTVPTGFRWHQHYPGSIPAGKILYSFTEDSNGNGRLDRIRVQTNKSLNGDFTQFSVSVVGYAVERYGLVSLETTASDDDSFYIYLKERDELDGGNTPSWSVIRNNSLKDTTGVKIAEDKNIIPIDTIPPRIAYTLTLPGKGETYLQMSEPVVSKSGGKVTAFFGGDEHEALPAAPANLGHLFKYNHIYSANDLAKLENIYKDPAPVAPTRTNGYLEMRDTIIDKGEKPAAEDPKFPPKYPIDWGYTAYAKSNGTPANPNVFIPPHNLLPVDMMIELANGDGVNVTPTSISSPVRRRITDVLISMTPNAADDNYFAWPTFVKPTGGNSSITDFDGTAYLEKDSIEKNGLDMQMRINNNLNITPITPAIFWTTADIPAGMRNPKIANQSGKIGGLWLPNVSDIPPDPVLYYYVPLSNINPPKPGINVPSSKLYNYNITANELANSGTKFEFIFRLNNSDMFVARLDSKTIPSDWYTLVRPFGFTVQGMKLQRGGVTILNNVINSDKKETALIRYDLTRSGRVTVQIYTLDGTLVKSIRRNEQRETGTYVDTWDGSNNGGRAVARGMYFVRVVGPDIDEIRKIMVVK